MILFKKLLPIILLFSLSIPVNADQIKGRYVWDDFSKGLNLTLSNEALPKNQGDVCENVRFRTELKSLTKRDPILTYGSADASEAILGMHRLYLSDGTKVLILNHGDEIETGNDATGAFTNILDISSGNYRWQWVTWHDIAIGTDGYNQPVKYDGSSASATYLGSCLALDAGSGAGPDGTYTYKVSYYTASYEVLLNVASNSITVVDNDISLSMIPIAPDTYGGENVVGRKIYRTLDGGSTYKLLTNGTIANNTAVILTDSDADAALGVVYPAGDATYTPPKCRFVIVKSNRLFFANQPTGGPSRAWYSEDGSPDIFVNDSYFEIRKNDGDEITFMKTLRGVMTIGKNNTIQQFYTDGDDPAADWSYSDPLSEEGCQAPYTAAVTPLGIFYLSLDGIYKFNGINSSFISDAVTPVIDDISATDFANCWAIFHKNIYHLSYTSESSGEASNNRILFFDVLSDAYSIDILSLNTFCSFNSGSDWGILYAGSSGDGTVYAYTSGTNDIIHKRHADFTGTWDDARYIPTTVGGDAEDPVIEISRTATIDSLVGIIDNLTGDINREDTDGSYTSQVLTLGASSLDKIYWNETIPVSGGDVTFQVRTGDTTPVDGTWIAWSSAVTDPSGSDISGVTAGTYLQYKINLTTTDIDYTPNVIKGSGYVAKVVYSKEGTVADVSIPLKWRSGWNDLKAPGQNKELKMLLCYYEGTAGTLTLTFEDYEGGTEVFNIDMSTYPNRYKEYFTTGLMSSEFFRLRITNDDLNALKIKKVVVFYDTAPLV